MNRYFKNSRGQAFRSGIGGCYPVNDGDPQNDDPEIDEDALDRDDGDRADFLAEQAESIADRECERRFG